ncbi:myosin heavy chain-related [Striga asiatica]|uniref:Myosin heavy chain-related n=1 Tax=Striga asiatica TaxID=4170 RepID=A0A5A7R501_STRAF|nr:myosin heavy chain-related [Striga asiatica]
MQTDPSKKKGKKRFTYDARWQTKEGYKEVIDTIWKDQERPKDLLFWNGTQKCKTTQQSKLKDLVDIQNGDFCGAWLSRGRLRTVGSFRSQPLDHITDFEFQTLRHVSFYEFSEISEQSNFRATRFSSKGSKANFEIFSSLFGASRTGNFVFSKNPPFLSVFLSIMSSSSDYAANLPAGDGCFTAEETGELVVYSPPTVGAMQPLRVTPISAVRVTPAAAATDARRGEPSDFPTIEIIDLGSGQSDSEEAEKEAGAPSPVESDVDAELVEETLRGDTYWRERVPMAREDAETDAAVEAATTAPLGCWCRPPRVWPSTATATAWTTPSVLTDLDLAKLRGKASFGAGVRIFAPYAGERIHCPPPGCIGVYRSSILLGLRFPLPGALNDILSHLGIGISQLVPTVFARLVGLLVLFRQQGWPDPTSADVRSLFVFKKSGETGNYYNSVAPGVDKSLIHKVPESLHGYMPEWFWVGGEWRTPNATRHPSTEFIFGPCKCFIYPAFTLLIYGFSMLTGRCLPFSPQSSR